MTRVTINRAGVNSFMERQGFGGGITGSRQSATALAARMVVEAQRNATGRMLNQRTGQLALSVRPIVRKDARTGAIEVGVGTVSEYGGHLENGTAPHAILPKNARYLRSGGPRGKGPNPTPLRGFKIKAVNHPGNPPKLWLRDAVNRVIGRPI